MDSRSAVGRIREKGHGTVTNAEMRERLSTIRRRLAGDLQQPDIDVEFGSAGPEAMSRGMIAALKRMRHELLDRCPWHWLTEEEKLLINEFKDTRDVCIASHEAEFGPYIEDPASDGGA